MCVSINATFVYLYYILEFQFDLSPTTKRKNAVKITGIVDNEPQLKGLSKLQELIKLIATYYTTTQLLSTFSFLNACVSSTQVLFLLMKV